MAEKELHTEIRAQVLELIDEASATVEEAREKGKKQPIRMDLPTMFHIAQLSQKDLQREIYSMLISALEKPPHGYTIKIVMTGNKVSNQEVYLLLWWTTEVEVRTRDAQDAFLRAHMVQADEVMVRSPKK